ncbi:MAG: multifunctional oxoglutarate decarboxylase/oxoglutarate dehydrogenase thiamine pyrophosphate-binding subunit/dihydrolipoyllysine-residue succinyltransferase subunit [Gemmatimonadetes bacterium]|nr:multifunctional oxoglutarate decarboxylase/oxoglutarate dehydrogenase thiamine pyrophosphate-binding subunit/dihydrolipoyllysine-residue succinyltransferase subunit [Gemmatimonadota bacterium]
MADQFPDPNVFETANAGFAQALYEEYLRDPSSVGAEWRRLFEAGRVGERPPVATGNGSKPAAEPPAAGNGAGAVPHGTAMKGPAARLAANMNESLSVPTATTFREISVRVLETRRAELNAALKGAGRSEKLSFTHLIGYALVRAAVAHPVMTHTFAMVDGVANRVAAPGVNLGIAVDVERKDGSRGLVVPVIRQADRMAFGDYLSVYEGLVEKARLGKLMPDDFVGATMTLTNPGGLGTVASVPRLMAGQGSIIAVGAIGFPPEYLGASADQLSALGVSKVMMITSTYDHRVIQGAESGSFLRTMEQLLQGEELFYQSIAESLGVKLGGPIAAAPPRPERPSIAIPMSAGDARVPADLRDVAAAMALVKALRTHGHLAARLDPLGSEPIGDPALDPGPLGLSDEVMRRIPAAVLRVAVPGDTLADALPNLVATYCGNIAYEVEHLASHEERVWLRQQIEGGGHRRMLDPDHRIELLDRLIQVEAFERFLHKAYLGQKRFSIEGLDLVVPILDAAIDMAADQGAREVVLGMAHRGRLNVLVHTLGRPYATIFAEFEGKKAGKEGEDEGTGDVKYHHGAEGAFVTKSGRSITVSLAHNPSHLEFVGPVVDGRARAHQTQRRTATGYHDPTAALPFVIHGDAAFAGQGVVQETLNLGTLRGYRTGGTVHVIANNQIGFTTDPLDSRSTRHASDLAKGFDIPIIHVNADDPEACLAAIRLTMMYRERFRGDVVIDLVGYRRHGHNEGDEPGYTQPNLYERIKGHPTVREQYAARLVAEGVLTAEEAAQRYQAAYQHLVDLQHGFKASQAHPKPSEPAPARVRLEDPPTAVDGATLVALNEALLSFPDGFQVHPKLKRQLDRRRVAIGPEGGIDWGHAEALAFASLLADGVPVRLTGQDCERGTFSHRHVALHDAATGQRLIPMQQLPGSLASFEVHNSPLSELATLGFEYGYATAASEALVVWEAQFGDFINGAQVIVDQFIAAGLSKWGVTSRLTLLLPHGYEGQGPEHSSARLERFLQLAAEGNMRVANCTTAAQYFHLLRRQARRNRQRPLVIFTPKSLLRLPAATSRLEELAAGRFEPVLDDPAARSRGAEIGRVVLCSGKVYYDLLARAETAGSRPALVRLERLYSFPDDELRSVLAQYPNLREVVWCQEEPRNMGAWGFVEPRLRALLPNGAVLRYVGRPERASPAEGNSAAHTVEQDRLTTEAVA